MQISSLRIVVTGAGSGMGRVFTRELATLGASVAAMDVDPRGLEGTLAECAGLEGRVEAFECDVSSETSVQTAFGAAWAALSFGNPDGYLWAGIGLLLCGVVCIAINGSTWWSLIGFAPLGFALGQRIGIIKV